MNILNRNVHPLYAVMAFIAAGIVLILYLYSAARHHDEKRPHLPFFIFVFIYCIQDGIWGLLASGIINNDTALMVSSAVFHISSAFAPLVWTRYFSHALEGLIRHRKILIGYNWALLVSELTMIIINFFNHFMFYVDETGNYQSTPDRKILFYMQFSVYILIAVISILGSIGTKSSTARKTYYSFLGVSLTPVFFDVFQMLYPDAPANSAGLCIACVLVHTVLSQNIETQVHELKAEAELRSAHEKELLSASVISTLSLEYGPLYLTDLQTGSLRVFRTSDMKRALPVQQLAFEIPEYLPFIREYASRYVMENDREAFLEWTDPKRLDAVITTENIIEFNYQRMLNGEQNYYQFCCARVSGEADNNLMIFGFRNVDTMVRKELKVNKALEKALEDVKVASEAKTRFLFNMSHDIRTPMNAILGYTDAAIKHREDQSRVDDSLSKIRVAGEHLLNLINDILEMSRIESGTLELSENPVDIRKLIDGITQMSKTLAIQKSIDFATTMEQIDTPYVYADELHLNEVIINLISNAIKYTPDGGRIRFNIRQTNCADDQKVFFRFEVADNGIGMSEEFQTHLFEAFSREKTSTVSKQQGVGLGLSIVKRIVDLAGGTISVKSKTGEGSVFVVEAAFRTMDEEAIHQYEEDNKPIDLAGNGFSFENKKVLLVEDNEMNREIATEILEETGMVIDTAEDGVFAVKAVEDKGTNFYDFILMDIQMPVMDGYEATKAIRALPGGDQVKIIALSANAFEEDIQKSLSIGMNAHVAKPIDVNALFETMKGLAE